jgi:hypothetical protein
MIHLLLGCGRAVGNRLGAHLAEGVTLPAVVPYALGLYLLARYAVVAAPIPWESILVPTSLSRPQRASRVSCASCVRACVVCVRASCRVRRVSCRVRRVSCVCVR